MGAGAGATEIIDSRSSLQVAVDEAEAEIRLEFAGQEDLRRQLLFLEKGRNLLDLKFGDASSTTAKPISQSDPLVEQNLESHAQGVVDDVAEIQSGLESSGKFGSTRSSGLVGGNHTPSRNRIEGYSVVHGPLRDQANIQKSRHRTNCYDNGQNLARDKVLLPDKEPAILYAPSKSKRSSLQGNSLPIEHIHNLLPSKKIQSIFNERNEPDQLSRKDKHVYLHSVSSNYDDLIECSVPLFEVSSEIKNGATLSSQATSLPLQHENSGFKQKYLSNERDVVNLDIINMKVPFTTNTADCETVSPFKPTRQVDPAKPGQLAAGDTTLKKIPVGVTTRDNLALTHKYPLHFENTLDLHSGESAEVLASAKYVSQSDYNKNLIMSHGNIAFLAKKNEALHGDRQSKNSIVDSKLKTTITVANQPELASNACSLNVLNDANISCDTMVQQESKKLNCVVNTGTFVETSLNNKAPSTGELASINFQRVSVDHELEEDKRMRAEEKCATAAKRAKEDTILEMAKVVKNSQDQIAKWASRKAMPELSRRKSHWEFVLEEVAWMANDFMQERLWKKSAAAQLCQWAAHCMYHSQFKAVRSEQEAERATFNTGKKVVMHLHSTGASLTEESFDESNQIELLDNCDIKVAVPVDVDNSTYQEGSLFYVVPEGALESYRNSVVRDWATDEAEHLAEAEAQACLVSESDMLAFGHETKPLVGQSLARIGIGDDSDKLEIQDITSSLDSRGCPQSAVAKRKRKQILKLTNMSSEVVSNVGLYLPDPDTFTSIPSDHTPAKRPFANSYDVNQANVRSIPTKRLRTAAVVARQRASGTAGSTLNKLGATGGLKESNKAGAMEAQQKGLHSSLEVSVTLRNAKAESSPRNSTQGATSDDICSSPAPKKKKNAKFHSVALSSTADGALHDSYSGKLTNSDYVQQYEVNRHVEQKAQIKRKSDQLQQTTSNVSSSDLGFGPISETPEILSSQGVAEQHLLKKVKLLKQLPEEHHDSVCTPIQIPATQAPLVANLISSHKVLRQNSSRDRDRAKKNKLGKSYFLQPPVSHPGVGIPWSTIEDQAILALVHDLGPNWELVSDVLSSSSQVKGIFRKPVDCEARHKALLECLSTDEVDSSEDVNNRAHSSSLRNSKVSIRMLLQRLQGPMEEDTLKVHFGHIVHIVQQDDYRRNQIKNDSQKLLEILPAHISHVSAMSQLSASSLTGGALTPLDLCDQPSLNAEAPTNAFIAHPPHLSGMGFTGVLSAGSRLRPSSASLPLLPSLHGCPALSPSSSVTMNAARDAQWMATSMRTLSAEEQRLRYTRLVTGRGLPQDPSSGTLSLMNLSHSSDRSVPILPMANNGSLIGGLSRSMSLPRPGVQTMLVSGVSGIVPAGINGMLPSAGIAVASTSALAAGSVQFNLMRRSRDAIQTIRAGQGTEDQRLMSIQELQHHASQGNTHAAAALSSLPSTTVSSPNHAFVLKQQQSAHQLQPQHPNQAYATLQLAKERRLQQEQEQQQQHHKRLLQQHHQQQQLQHNSSFQPQSHSLAHHQPTTTHQQKLHSQHVNPTMPASTLQEQSATPLSPPTLLTSRRQQSLTTTQHHQSLGPSAQDSSHQVLNQKQLQSHQHLQSQVPSRGIKGPGRGAMIGLPSVSSQQGQSSLLAIPMENQRNLQLLQQIPNHLQGQRVVPPAGSIQLEKQSNSASQLGTPEQPVQVQGQGVNRADNSSTSPQQTNELLFQQQLPVKQQSSPEHIHRQQPQLATLPVATQPQQHLPSTMIQPQQQLPSVGLPVLPQSPPTQSLHCQLHRQPQVLPPQHGLQEPPTSSKMGL